MNIMKKDKIEAACNLNCAKKKLEIKIRDLAHQADMIGGVRDYAICIQNLQQTGDSFRGRYYQDYSKIYEIKPEMIKKLIREDKSKLIKELDAIEERMENL